jgi:predicted MFS family arabinose efflux permease
MGGVRPIVVALTAFLTLVDLFATQAILPSLARAYDVSPAAMGLAVNASSIGMAIASLIVALFSQTIDRRLGAFLSLAFLAVPTALLAMAPNLAIFTTLRIAQGLCMASAFTLTLAYLGEHSAQAKTAAVFAAYVTGNVGSNLFGRLMSAALVDHLGLAANFATLSGLNLLGALLVYTTLEPSSSHVASRPCAAAVSAAVVEHLRDHALLATFAIGFCILFAFIGVFTFVNFVLVRPPLGLSMMALGFVYFVFLPSMLTTPVVGVFTQRFGFRWALWGGLVIAISGLPLLLAPLLVVVIVGLALVGVGTFFAQAVATGYVGWAVTRNRSAASGLYLASYFSGGLVGSIVLGQAFDRFGWAACVFGIGISLAAAAVLAPALRSDVMGGAACAGA